MPEPRKARAIAGPLTWERPGDVTRAPVDYGFGTALVLFIVRPLWALRVELGLVLAVLTLWGLLGRVFGPVVSLVLTTAVVIGALSAPSVRTWLRSLLVRRRTVRDFERACRYGLVVSMNDRTPKPVEVRDVPAGHVLTVEMPPGLSTLPLVDASEVLASHLGVREVRVERLRERADRASVTVVRRDPLGERGAITWPPLAALPNRDVTGGLARLGVMSIWDPIPVGVDEMGEVVSVRMIEKNLSIAGEPGAGKSVGQSMPVAVAALDASCDLYLFDGNRVEFAPWAKCSKAFVGPSQDEAKAVLEGLVAEMHRRYEVLMAEERRKVAPGDGLRPIVVVVNELAFYLASENTSMNKTVGGLMRTLVAQGRAAGIIMITATQKPSADVIPTYLRDLFSYRWAMRCSTPQASDTVLGQGWAARGFNAAEIDSANRGVGMLLTEGGEPRRLKSFYLSDDDIAAIAARAFELRNPTALEGGDDVDTRSVA